MQKMFGVRFFKSYSNIAQVSRYILLFLVNGGAQIITSGKTYELEKEDYIIINSAKQYQVLLKKFPFAGNFNGKRGAMFLVT